MITSTTTLLLNIIVIVSVFLQPFLNSDNI